MSSDEVFFCIAIFINFVWFYYCLFSLRRGTYKLEERIFQLEKIAQKQQDINGIQIELNKSFNDAIVKGESGPEFFPTISCINIEWPEKK